jgi:hypothetical protein
MKRKPVNTDKTTIIIYLRQLDALGAKVLTFPTACKQFEHNDILQQKKSGQPGGCPESFWRPYGFIAPL